MYGRLAPIYLQPSTGHKVLLEVTEQSFFVKNNTKHYFISKHWNIIVEYIIDDSIFRLKYGQKEGIKIQF